MCVELTQDDSTPITLGHLAHIEALSDDGPRANPGLSLEQRNAYDSLIVLCPNHHRKVDADENTVHGWHFEIVEKGQRGEAKGLSNSRNG